MNKEFSFPHIDWLGFTFKGRDPEHKLSDIDYFLKVFPEFDLAEKPMIRSKNGYLFSMLLTDTIIVSFNGRESDMGVNVQCSSQALYDLAKIMGTDNMYDIFLILKLRECQLCRIDIAYDDFEKRYSPADFMRYKEEGRLQLSAHRYKFIGSTVDTNKASTFYAGTRSSGKMIRIYDKSAESNGKIDAIRYEGEFHGIKARFWHDYILEHQGLTFAQFIAVFLRVLVENKDKTKDDVATDPEWESFINTSLTNKEIRVPSRRPVRTIESTSKFISNARRACQVAVEMIGVDQFIEYIYSVELDDALKLMVDRERNKDDFLKLLRETL